MIPIWPFKLALLIGVGLGLRPVRVGDRRASCVTLVLAPADDAPARSDVGGRSLAGPLGWLVALAAVAGMIAFTYLLFTCDLRPIAVGVWCLAAMLVLVFLGMPIPLVLMGLSYVGIWVARGGGVQRAQHAGPRRLERGRLLRVRHHSAFHHDGRRAGESRRRPGRLPRRRRPARPPARRARHGDRVRQRDLRLDRRLVGGLRRGVHQDRRAVDGGRTATPRNSPSAASPAPRCSAC